MNRITTLARQFLAYFREREKANGALAPWQVFVDWIGVPDRRGLSVAQRTEVYEITRRIMSLEAELVLVEKRITQIKRGLKYAGKGNIVLAETARTVRELTERELEIRKQLGRLKYGEKAPEQR